MTREEARGVIKSECYIFDPLNLDRSTMVNTALDMAIIALEQEPCDCISREEPTYKTGKWVYSGSYDEEGTLYCSNCKHKVDVSEDYFKYCPNCGARMNEDERILKYADQDTTMPAT